MKKHCGNCAVYDRKNMKHSELCGKCVMAHYPNGKDSDPSMWKPLPQTNADRIRATTNDRELANILLHLPLCQNRSDCERKGIKCSECLYEWLIEPAEGE